MAQPPASTLFLYNTWTNRIEEFTPADPQAVTFYTCGPTVYDDAHIGNFRSFLAADVLRRWVQSPLCSLRARDGEIHPGPRRMTHVMNITDVGHMTDDGADPDDPNAEDKMQLAGRRLQEAKKAGKLPPEMAAKLDPSDPYQIAEFYTRRFLDDARRLGLQVAIDAAQDPSLMPRATQNIQGMIAVIERLIERGHAYTVGQTGRQTVYFEVGTFAPYGRLSGNTLDRLREGAGGRIAGAHQAEKRHPADFLLWKSDPSHIMKWPSPWGEGYPGWHIECTVMSIGRLAEKSAQALSSLTVPDGLPLIDLHSGGEDNIFPHHECEVAQSCCAFNAEPERGSFAALWFHPRFLLVEGEKMSKSKGNFFTARDLFAKGHDPAAVRLELIRTNYRTNANFTEQGLKDSARMVDRWRRFMDAGRASKEAGQTNEHVRAAFTRDMNDDLNIAGAIGTINKWVAETPSPTKADAGLMQQFDDVLGLLALERLESAQTSIGIFMPGTEPDDRVIALLEDRRAARAAKDFARSDAIRDQLAALGYTIKDVAGGRVEVSRKS
jgi:cysteinyl-tRNA synthetase